MTKRIAVFVYGAAVYALFFGTFCYAAGFLGNMIVPVSMDSAPVGPFGESLFIDLVLLSLFAVQHSLMARPFFKRWLTRYIPEAAERSTYVLLSSLALILLFWQWRPLGGVIWSLEGAGATVMYALFASGFLLVLVTTFLLNHFDLFGLRQVWLYLRGIEYTPLKFGTPFLYRKIRHPLYVGWMIAFWATPVMTATHLLYAVMTSAYMLVAIPMEEKDLEAALPEYKAYKEQVPMFVPRPGRSYQGRTAGAATV